MKVRMGTRTVHTPAGVEWRVGRRWLSRRLPHWRKVRMGKPRAGDAAEAVLTIPDFGGLDDLGAAVLVVVAVVVVAVVVVPLLLFGIELIVLGLVVAAGIVGRALLGRPWVVQAAPADGEAHVLAWKVGGWRRSARVINEVATALNSGLDPSPDEAAEQIEPRTSEAAIPFGTNRR
jgi:hypothetical protein